MGLLTIAGGLKGANEAAQHGLNQYQAMLSAQTLQLGSQGFAREQADTAYERGRFDVENERTYTAKREQELRSYTEAAPVRAQTQAELLQPRKSALAAKEFREEAPTRKAAAIEDVTNEVTKATLLAENKAWIKAQMILANAKESSASRAQAAKTLFELERGKQGAKLQDDYLKLMNDPHADPMQVSKAREAWASFSTKPGESEKVDASNAAAGLKEAGNEIVRLQSMMEMQAPGTPGYVALERRLQNAEAAHEAYDARVRELTGTKLKPAAPEKIDLSSLDPWQTSPLSKKTTPGSNDLPVPSASAGVITTPKASTMQPRTLDEAMRGAGGSVNLPRTAAPQPSLQEVQAYIDAQGTNRESQVRSAYLRKYGTPPTQVLLSQLQREAKGGG